MSRHVARICVVTEIPTPYRLPLYERLAARADLELVVLFCASGEPDRPWNVDRALETVPHNFLPGWSPAIRTRRNTFVYEINPSIFGALRHGRYDAIVIGGYSVFAEQAAIAWACTTRVPFVIHSESHLQKQRPGLLTAAKEHVLPRILSRAAAGMAVGSLAAEYLTHYGVPSNRIRIVPNTIDVPAYKAAAARARQNAREIRARRDLPEHFLVFAGRLVEAKGIDDLVEALRILGEDAPLVIVAGEGPLRGELAPQPGIRLVGFQSQAELIELWALAAGAVVPSRDEPWGVVVNEASACGCAVLATDAVGAATDLIVDGENGRITPAGNPIALAKSLSTPLPRPYGPQPIDRWDYDLAESQFVEAIQLAVAARDGL
jgi:glycosyltransferase involved in cell wall biosynthesis